MKRLLQNCLKLSFLLVGFLQIQTINATTEKYRLTLRDDPSTTIVVGWNQTSGTNPVVYYGTTDQGTNWNLYTNNHGVDRSVTDRGMDNRFSRLTGLLPNTVYYFVIKDSDGTSARYSFRTLPNSPTERLSIIAGGDSRNNRTPRQNANSLVAKLRPHAVMFGGDFTSSGTNTEWAEWFDDWQLTIGSDGRMTALIATRGNHESNNNILVNLFDVPSVDVYYALTLGGSLLRVYTLNTEISISGNQTTWLTNDLAASQSIYWRFAQYHKPMRPHTSSKAEGNSQYSSWSSLFQTQKVKLIVECDAHTVKTTWPVVPSSAAGSDEGFIQDNVNGSVYVGEGCWGAPLRSNNDDKNWTRNSGMFNHVNWIFIDQNNVEARKVKVDNASQVGSNTDATRFSTPANTDIWNPSNGSVVTINNNNNLAPTVSISSPANGTNYPSPQQITITASANDADGTVSSVEFFQNGVSIGVDNTAPFSINWTIPANGNYSLSAKATDNGGAIGFSSVVSISSGNSFTLNKRIASGADDVEENANGSIYDYSTDIELVNDGSRGDQIIGLRFTGITIPNGATITNAYIQFTCDETSSGATNVTIKGQDIDDSPVFGSSNNDVSTRTTTTASMAWAPLAWNTIGQSGADQQTPNLVNIISEIIARPGWSSGNALSIIITGTGARTAEAFEGSSTQAAELIVDYTLGSVNVTPVVNITSPAANAVYNSLANINIDATASDPDGSITQVNFYQNGALIGSDNSSPYSVNWTIPAYGNYSLSAEAVDNGGATTTDVIQISATNSNQPPVVSITSPVSGTNYNSPQQITITASATDPDGTVSSVEFYQNGSYIATDNSAPFSINWTIPFNGSYNIMAKAIDNNGASTFSPTIIITSGSNFSFTKRISSGSDDVEEAASGTMYSTSSDLELVFDSYNSQNNQIIGLRFTGVSIPQGAIITNAYVQFTCDETDNGATNLTVTGHANDNSSAFSSTSGDVSSRIRTLADANWTPPAWNTVGQSGVDQQTPNISNVISEIITRAGWSSGNALTIIITGTGERTAESWEGSASQAAELVVDYMLTAPNVAPTVTLDAPLNNSTYSTLATINIDATAADSDGTIDYVDFTYNGGTFIARDFSAPYSVNWTIPAFGNYTIEVEAVDDDGDAASASIQITATAANQPPVAVISKSISSPFAPVIVNFDGAGSTDADGTIASYAWSFGDGNTSTAIAPVHTYYTQGTYAVTLTVTDDDGDTHQASTSVSVLPPNILPSSSFTVSTTTGQAPHAITFDGAGSYDGDGTIDDYAWDFGDGTTTNGPAGTHGSLSHTYTTDGTFTAVLTVTDNAGATAFSSKTITITPANQVPVAVLSTSLPKDGQAPHSVTFYGNTSSDPDGSIASHAWDFGDGSVASTAVTTHIFNAGPSGNTYNVILTVTDNNGATSSANINIVVSAPNVDPVASFTNNVSSGFAPLSVNFDASASSDPDNSGAADNGIASFAWNYGDGNSGTGKTPTYIYTTTGNFTVTLTVTDAQGATHATSSTINVSPSPSGLPIEFGKATAVGDSWTTINTTGTYTSMVVVATPIYTSNSLDPVVTRVKNAGGSSFQLKVQNPGGTTTDTYDVEYIVVEEGTYTVATDGIKMEAVKINSTKTSKKSSWVREIHNYANAYSAPVVLGQVMTENDVDWSVFWGSKYNSRTKIATGGIDGYAAGKHLGEDIDVTRANETIGVLIFESGTGNINSKVYEAGYTADVIKGVGNTSAGYSHNIGINAENTVLSSAAMDGKDGGWPVFKTGGNTGTSLVMWIDEDQISNSERNHTTEEVAYFSVGTAIVSKTNSTPGIADNSSNTNFGSEIEAVLYPNPTNGHFAIRFSEEIGENLQVQVVDYYGRVVMVSRIEMEGEISSLVDISGLPNGQYIIIVKSDKVYKRLPVVMIK